MSARRVYGIDLGTTYSCIAHVDEHGKPVVLPNAEGELTTPSVVFFESLENRVVGNNAKEVASIYHDRCVSTIKRSIGDATWKRTFYDEVYTPQDISSFILRKVVKDAEVITGAKIEDVVITCPAYFGINEKEATKQAGILAGLNVLYVIPEPTAAALAYGISQDEDQVVLVYDLGGGTFDVTVLQIEKGEIRVVCTGGDHQLGGKDWDDAIVEFFAQSFEAETGISEDDLLEDQETYQELLNDAESAKRSLSGRESVLQKVAFDGEKARVELTREKFEELTAHLMSRTLSMTEEQIEVAQKKGYDKIDKLLLVGGSTYMPQVIEGVNGHFPGLEVIQFDPNQSVAKGAALYGYKCYLEGEIRIRVAEETGQKADEISLDEVSETVLERAHEEVAREQGIAVRGLQQIVEKKVINVSSKSFGMVAFNEQDREVVFNLIKLNDPVPKVIKEPFQTRAEGQTQVNMRCMENVSNEDQVEINRSKALGETVLNFSKALPQGSPIEVTFDMKADGLLRIMGYDQTTGRDIQAEFQTESILSVEEVETARERNLNQQVN